MTGNPAGRGTVPPTPGRARKTGIPRQSPELVPHLLAGHRSNRLTLASRGRSPCLPWAGFKPAPTFSRAFRTEILFECSRLFRRINPPVKPLSASRPQAPLQALVPACRGTWAGIPRSAGPLLKLVGALPSGSHGVQRDTYGTWSVSGRGDFDSNPLHRGTVLAASGGLRHFQTPVPLRPRGTRGRQALQGRV
jgi:hypothetical protein